MATRKPDDERIGLLQGTLDLLILRTLLFGREHGQGIARAIQAMSGEILLVRHGGNVVRAVTTEKSDFIGSRLGVGSNSIPRPGNGTALQLR